MHPSTTNLLCVLRVLTTVQEYGQEAPDGRGGKKREGISRLWAAFNIIKCNWGVGMMAMPYMLDKCGAYTITPINLHPSLCTTCYPALLAEPLATHASNSHAMAHTYTHSALHGILSIAGTQAQSAVC